MNWVFTPLPENLVETEVTQRDQFNTDQTGLSETLLREAVQNSLDAAIDTSKAEVTFRWITHEDGLDASFMRKIFEGHLEHAERAGINLDDVDFSSPSALVIEDFGTSGLTGNVDEKDNDNFCDFWRRHGKSHKKGTARGRWGLGKLVYSCSSRLSAFFGITVRNDDPGTYLMGQTVLGIHELDGTEYPAHTFYSNSKNDDRLSLQIPIICPDHLDEFRNNFNLERKENAGLSVIIPFPIPDLNQNEMIGTGIKNYFYPIIMDQLVIKVGAVEITSSNIRELASEYLNNNPDIDKIFDFIFEMKSADEKALPELHESWIDDKKLDEDDLDEELLESLRDKFASGALAGVRLPVTVTRKVGKETKKVQTGVSLFIKQPEGLTKGLDLYLRGGLTLPEEAKFGQRKALGALIASDEGIADFLGNAENAAHTKWDAKAEKLHNNYMTPRNTLTAIRHSVVNFFDMLAQAVDEEDEHALMEFFWEEVPGQKHAPKKTGQTPNDIENPPSPRPKPCAINKIENGFSLSPGADIAHFSFPLKVRIRACYDTCAGNPFKKFSPLDFDFRKKSDLNMKIKGIYRHPTDRYANMIEFEITDPDFHFQATGFDPNRDLLLKVSTVEE